MKSSYRWANGHGLREAGAAGLFLSEASARLSGQRGQRARKKTEAIWEVRIIMARTILSRARQRSTGTRRRYIALVRRSGPRRIEVKIEW
ncbi:MULTISPECIES: hypothetical protein [unclassified Bradyrhizobium]|uniref:hypothetical protein n=1 Tax=unclassified Bradyrhizobium TaxID=2631580 RepID=UPI002FF279E5